LAGFSGGCGRPPPLLHLRLTGAQIATDLVESWLNDSRTPRFVVERARNPTWSGVGFESLAQGECDLACTDRPIERGELEKFAGQQVRGLRVAFYGYALYVHPSNPLDSIFAKHISLVFRREVVDWSELAGHNIPSLSGPINLYGPRKATRGGEVLMRQANVWFADATWRVLDSDEQIIDRVAADPLGLGFASVGYHENVRALGIRMRRDGPPAFPSLEEVEDGRYGLAKVIYVYFVSPPAPVVQAAIDYLFSPEGQRAIERTGVWPIARGRADLPSSS